MATMVTRNTVTLYVYNLTFFLSSPWIEWPFNLQFWVSSYKLFSQLKHFSYRIF